MWFVDAWNFINNLINTIFTTVFGNNVSLATFFISMIPIVELRGAIPFATNTAIWGNLAINNWQACLWSMLGSSLIVPLIILTSKPMINWLKKTKPFKKIATSLEDRAKNKSKAIDNSEGNSALFSKAYWKKMIGLFVFVAIPLPFTGVWTGAMIALFLNLDFPSSCISIILGNVFAGLFITLILEFFPALNNWLLWIFVALIILTILFRLLCMIVKKIKNRKTNVN